MYIHSFTLLPGSKINTALPGIYIHIVAFESPNLLSTVSEFQKELRRSVKDNPSPYDDDLLEGRFSYLSHVILKL